MKTLVFLFFMIPVISLGQGVFIDFENNNLTDWYQGSSNHWCASGVNALEGGYSLAHCYDDTAAGSDWVTYFYEPLNTELRECSWQFMLRYDHNPSSNNYWLVFLTDNMLPDEDGKINSGLILGVNFEGNSDEIMLWYIKEDETTCLLNTGFNWEENITPGHEVSLKLIRSINGIYTLDLDTSDTGYFTLGSFQENTFTRFNTFTLYYKYTAAYDQGLGLDNLSVDGSFGQDTNAPAILLVAVVNPRRLEVQFSEPVNCDPENDFCVDDIGCGEALEPIADKLSVNLPNPLFPGNTYNLQLPSVTDVYGNFINQYQLSYPFYYPKAGDVLINELLANPSPPVMLPETEYIELYNYSREIIHLQEWALTVNNQYRTLKAIDLHAGEYALICDTGYIAQFDTGLLVIPLDMPALNNTSAKILLQDRSGKLIHAINYSNEWFESSDKKEGGWSLEMINPRDPCGDRSNWEESSDFRGGTPGEPNSVLNVKRPNRTPELWRAAVTDSGSLILYFSEPMDSTTLCERSYYSVDHSIGSPSEIHVAWPLADRIELFFHSTFESVIRYEIALTSDLCDCSGTRLLQTPDNLFSVPSVADSGDVIINEFMFDPELDMTEYIELYNNSDETIDLKDCKLIVGELTDSGRTITTEYWPLLPGSYTIIARGYSDIDRPGMFDRAERIICMNDMPHLPNAGSKIFLIDKKRKILDKAFYLPERHHDILTETKGVSLERISSELSGLDKSNWHSASSDRGYKTPAAPNSQSSEESAIVKVSISPETITPDANGVDDELSICYHMDKPGYMAIILIFDSEGRKQCTLANGTLLGTEGCYTFNGEAPDGNVMPSGYYVLYFDAYNDKGDRQIEKRAFVVAR